MWANWSGGRECRPTATARPLDESGVAAVVRRAAERGQVVRPVGSGHAFSGLAVTDGVHVDCSAFSGITAVAELGGRTTVRVRAGTTVGELHDELAARALALAVPLEIAGPTVGGALAAGMHGSGVGAGSLSEQVVGLRVVDGQGRVRDVGPTALDAARTSLGALGVVLDAELVVVPADRVQVTRGPRPVDEVLDPGFWGGHDIAEAGLFPSAPVALARWADRLPGSDTAPAGTGRDATTGGAPGAEAAGARGSTGDDGGRERRVGFGIAGTAARTALGRAVAVERALPRLVPRVNRVVSRLARTVTASGPAHRVLSSPPSGRFEQTEWALPREALAAGARELLAALAAARLEVGLPVRMRVGAPERGWLHPAYGRRTGWLSVRIPRGADPAPVLETAYAVLRDHDGRPHWGGRHDWTVADTEAAYPRAGDFRRVRDDYDPERVFANPELASVLGS